MRIDGQPHARDVQRRHGDVRAAHEEERRPRLAVAAVRHEGFRAPGDGLRKDAGRARERAGLHVQRDRRVLQVAQSHLHRAVGVARHEQRLGTRRPLHRLVGPAVAGGDLVRPHLLRQRPIGVVGEPHQQLVRRRGAGLRGPLAEHLHRPRRTHRAAGSEVRVVHQEQRVDAAIRAPGTGAVEDEVHLHGARLLDGDVAHLHPDAGDFSLVMVGELLAAAGADLAEPRCGVAEIRRVGQDPHGVLAGRGHRHQGRHRARGVAVTGFQPARAAVPAAVFRIADRPSRNGPRRASPGIWLPTSCHT